MRRTAVLEVAPGAVAALICDGAGWRQTGGALELPDNVVLVPLPPYAPELNPMENVWQFLRVNKRLGQLRRYPQRLRRSLELVHQRH